MASATEPAPAVHRPSPVGELKNSPELELVLLCARRNLNIDRVRRALRLLEHPLNWSLLIEQAEVHGLFPLLYWHGTRTLALAFPPEIAQQLNSRFRANAARSLLLIRDLANTLELLGSRGIPVIPFKGPALAETLYGDAALRQCVDLDILLRSCDVPEAIRTLVSAGYEAPTELTTARQNAFIATQYEYAFLSPAGNLVELQWRILPRYFSLALPEGQYWSRIQSLKVFGRKINALSCEDLLLLLCFHGGKHGWDKLIWLADVAELITSTPHLEWEYVLEHARRAGGLRMLLLAVILANRFLETTIAEELEQPVARDRTVGQIADSICRNFDTGELPTYVQSQLYLLRVRERWRDRLRYLIRFALTPTPMEWKIVDLPPSLSSLYSFLRVLRGLGKALSLARNAASRFVKSKLLCRQCLGR